MFTPLCVLAAACAEPVPIEKATLGEIETRRESLPAATHASVEIESNRILSLDVDRCAIPDPAVDAWDTGAGVGAPPIVTEIHAGLTKFTGGKPTPVALELAESFTAASNGRDYTFKLRPNLKFSDGSPLTSADVKASWERTLRLASPRGYATKFLGQVLGAGDIIDGDSTELEGVEVIDDRTIRIRLSKPSHGFEVSLAHPVASVLKIENVGHWDGLWSNDVDPHPVDLEANLHPAIELYSERLPVGAGPFKLTAYASYGHLQRCVLSRNSHYWGIQTDLDHVVLENHAGQVLLVGYPGDVVGRLFAQRSIDLNPWVLTELTDEQLDDLDNVRGVSRITVPVEFAVLALNDRRYPLNVDEVRQTLINRANLVKHLYDADFPRPNRIIPELLGQSVGTVEPVSFDETTNVPRELRNGEMPSVFHILDDDVVERFGFHHLLSDITDEWWSEFGINFRVINRASEQFSQIAQAGRFDGRLWQTTVQSPDPGHIFASFANPFGESEVPTKWNKLTSLYRELELAVDEASRSNLYARIEQVMLHNSLGAALFWGVGWMPVAVQPYVHGFTGVTFPRSMFHNVWMDDSAPERPVP